MGCMSSVQAEQTQPNNIALSPPQNQHNGHIPMMTQPDPEPIQLLPDPSPSAELIQSQTIPFAASVMNTEQWSTTDLVAFLCSMNNGKLCHPQYDAFKASLYSMGINGQTMITLSDPNMLRDIGLTDAEDIDLIQQTILSLCSQQQDSPALEHVNSNDDFFPSDWTFPVENDEILKNRYYVGQRLIITQKGIGNHATTPRAIAGRVVYVENNWIVVQCHNDDAHSDEQIAENQYERLHAVRDQDKIHRVQYQDEAANCTKTTAAVDDEGLFKLKSRMTGQSIFDDDNAYCTGMSYAMSSGELCLNVIPQCYVDPITYEIMNDPVTSIKSGRTYDRSVIEQHLEEYGSDPFTQRPLHKEDLRPNAHLRRAIQRYIQNNPDVVTVQ